MTFRDLVPWHSDNGLAPLEELPPDPASARLNFSENENEYLLTLEVPGLEEKDLKVGVTEASISLEVKKEQAFEEKGPGFHHTEHSYGSFQQTVPLPVGVDRDKIQAVLKNGVLTLRLPKTAEAKSRRKVIDVKAAQ
jgi:HSP20 family protein